MLSFKSSLPEKSSRWFFLFCMTVSTSLFVYVAARSYYVGITGDESSSLQDILYMSPGYFIGNTTNTHLINTIFMYVEYHLLGIDEWCLRIHSVLSFLLYSYFVYKLSSLLNDCYLKYTFFICCLMQPFLLDFFSLARGYAMSTAFFSGFLYHFYYYLTSSKSKNVYTAFVFLILATLCNYTLLLALFIAYLLFWASAYYFNRSNALVFLKKNISQFLPLHLLVSTFGIGCFFITRKLSGSYLLDYFPARNFWFDSIYSLVSMNAGNINSLLIPGNLVVYFFVLFLILFSIVASVAYIRKEKKLPTHVFSVFLLLGLTMLMDLSYLSMQNPYLSHRTAIFLIPLLAMMIFFTTHVLSLRFQYVIRASLVVLAMLCMINFGSQLSMTNTREAHLQNDLKDAMLVIKNLTADTKEISLGVGQYHYEPVNYYLLKFKLQNIKNASRPFSLKKSILWHYHMPIYTGRYDYFIVNEKEKRSITSHIASKTLYFFPETSIYILKKDKI